MEIFKAIQGYEKYYEVSDLGRVKSLPRLKNYGGGYFLTKERFLNQRLHANGYYRVNLCGDKGTKMYTIEVHLLVINAFHPKEEDRPHANHKDLDRTNNKAENLEWVNRRENTSHSAALRGTKHGYRYVYSADNKTNPYGAKIKMNGKTVGIGCFKTPLLAYKAALKFKAKNNIINKYI